MRLIRIFRNPNLIMVYLIRVFPKLFSQKICLNALYKVSFRKDIDWKNPSTYNEKLQWLKVYDRKPQYSNLVDKYEVKKIVSEIIGQDHIIPTLGVWDSTSDINFDSLPDSFVLKCTHDSGSVVICKAKKDFDFETATRKLNKAMSRNYYYRSYEYPYLNVKPRIIAEPYMVDFENGQLFDYKLFCFDGKFEYLFIASDRATEVKFDYFDKDFNPLPMRQAAHPNSTIQHAKPKCFQSMVSIAEQLSKGIPQLRVDFYVANNKLLFGELTFFHHGGFVPFIPEKYDMILGDLIKLPKL